MSEQEHDFTDDPNWGKGGRYVFDPATGKRTPATEEPPAPPAPPLGGVGESVPAPTERPEQATETATETDPIKPLKEKRRA